MLAWSSPYFEQDSFKIRDWVFQWKIFANTDEKKQVQEVLFIQALILLTHELIMVHIRHSSSTESIKLHVNC